MGMMAHSPAIFYPNGKEMIRRLRRFRRFFERERCPGVFAFGQMMYGAGEWFDHPSVGVFNSRFLIPHS